MSQTDPALYDAYATDIDQAIAGVCRCHHLRGAAADDFAQNIRVWLLDDAAALLQLNGKSDEKAYLYRTIDNKFLDWSRQCNGRWRPSADARREGRLAIEAEALVEREGLTPREAIETMHAKRGASYEHIEALLLRLPGAARTRSNPRVLSLSTPAATRLSERAVALHSEDLHCELDDTRMADRIQTSLNLAWLELETDQQQILVKHYGIDGATTAAGADGRDRPVNRAHLRLALDALRELLASCGIGWPEVRRALESGEIEMNVDMPATGPDEGTSRHDTTRHDTTGTMMDERSLTSCLFSRRPTGKYWRAFVVGQFRVVLKRNRRPAKSAASARLKLEIKPPGFAEDNPELPHHPRVRSLTRWRARGPGPFEWSARQSRRGR
jgi:DNA-directed RNA polymerase specialized sigma24 family protein